MWTVRRGKARAQKGAAAEPCRRSRRTRDVYCGQRAAVCEATSRAFS